MKPYWKGRLLLLALVVGLVLSGSGSNAQLGTGIIQDAIGDAEELGKCVASKVFSPPRGAAPPVGCDYVLKLAAAGSWPGSAAQYVDKCCRLLTTEATTDCFCPLLEHGSLSDAMDSVCKNGEITTMMQQCGSGANSSSQDGVDLAGELGACVARKVFSPPRGAGGEAHGCDYVLRLAAAGSFPATEERYVNQCCDLLTTEADQSGCICPLLLNGSPEGLDAMDSLCGGVATTLMQHCQ